MHFLLAYLALAIVAFIGWVMNFIDVINIAMANAPFSTLFVIKLIGIPIPFLGAILGWF
ncbi:hypothetical protein [Sinorhizobium medicae]|uniref:hypothetical protein n=1 Tax=Sinorhizobium medicae TaxID=110321 RepID=UPI0013E2B6BA|nr:hypothetical protein [Sinorhizobium medicae]